MWGRLLARKAAGVLLGNLAGDAVTGQVDLLGWRDLVSQAAQSGDLDALFEAYVNTARQKSRDFIQNG